MRLIDADKFKQEIAAATVKNNLVTSKCNAICELIDRQPIAYDVDKVVEQLEEYVKESNNADYNRAMIEAIEIVRRGRNDD